MKFVAGVVRAFFGCRHQDTYRERRTLHGVDVLHLVCHDCGHAVPALQRTAEEHQDAVRNGALRLPTAHRAPVIGLARKMRKSA